MDLSLYSSQPPRVGSGSPWDRIDEVDRIVPGIVDVFTPGHGGVWLSREWIAKLPEPVLTWCFKQRDSRAIYTHGPQWFEEDCAWAIPFAFLPAADLLAAVDAGEPRLRLERRLKAAPETVRHWWPDLGALLPGAPALPAEVWREVRPNGMVLSREAMRDLVLADGYNPAHVDAYLDACGREDAGFLVLGRKSGMRRFFERVHS